jgi:hypothetical protein
LEWLEARTLLSPPPFVDSWINPNGGDWNNPANWSLGVPKSSSNVLIDLPGINFTVTHSLWKNGAFFSLTLGNTATLMVTGGGLAGHTFNNSGNFIVGLGTSANLLTLNNSGTLNVQGGALSVTNLTQTGTFILGAGGTTDVLSSLINSGTIDVQAGTLTAADFTQAGSFTLEAATNASIGNSFTNTGTVDVLTGADLAATNYSQSSGATNLANGVLDSTNAIDIQGGMLSGPGTINTDVLNAGEISPGAPGTLAINGNYTQTATGILDIGLAGTTPGAEFDQVQISGIASLDGVFNVNDLNNFAPSPGQSFQVMQFNSSSGAFAVINGLNAANTTTLIAQYNAQDLTLLVQSIVPINPPPVLPGLPPVLPNTASLNPKSNNGVAAGTTVPPPNFQTLPGLSVPIQAHYSGGASQGHAPVGEVSDPTSGKHSQDVAFAGGSGEEDKMILVDFPVRLNLASDEEVFSASDIATALLIGVRPKLLPQKSSQVALVATLQTEDSNDGVEPATATDNEGPLQDSLISPLGQFDLQGFQSLAQKKLNKNLVANSLDGMERSENQSKGTFLSWSGLAVLAGALVALWGIQEYRSRKIRQKRACS